MNNNASIARRLLAAAVMTVFLMVSVMAGTESVSAATKLKVTPAKKTIYVGKTVTLKSNTNVSWSVASGKSAVKLISKKKRSVKVKGLKAGTAVIKVKAGKQIKKVKITVKKKADPIPANAPKELKVSINRDIVGVGENCTVRVDSVVPETADKKVTFSTSDKSVATVSSKGLVTGVEPGTATITVKSALNSKVTAKVDVIVVKVKEGQVTAKIDLTDTERYPEGKVAKVWLPLPETSDVQKITTLRYSAPAAKTERTYDSAGGSTLYIEWGEDVAPVDRVATLTFQVKRREVPFRENLAELESGTVDTAEFADYLKETARSGSFTEGIVKETADKIVADAGAETVYDKARAIYDWSVENLFRDPASEHFLDGDVVAILSTDYVGAGCTDVNAVYVALCRAVGVPAREIMGLRLAPCGQKCKAQFYLPGYGWVDCDPSQPLKIILGNEESYRGPDAQYAQDWKLIKEAFWGTNDDNWIMFNDGSDVTLDPPQSATETNEILNEDGTINFFLLPYGEFDGKYITCYKKAEFKYDFSFEEADPNDCGC